MALDSCSTIPVTRVKRDGNIVTLPQSLFTNNELHIIKPADFMYDIAVRKENDGNIVALLLVCTHAANQLVASGSGFGCNLHGSKFDQAGAVIRGPAERSLSMLTTSVSEMEITIHLDSSSNR